MLRSFSITGRALTLALHTSPQRNRRFSLKRLANSRDGTVEGWSEPERGFHLTDRSANTTTVSLRIFSCSAIKLFFTLGGLTDYPCIAF
jgi:hypothetical protein